MTTKQQNPELKKVGKGELAHYSISHLVEGHRNSDDNGNCEMLVKGFGWCKYYNRSSAISVNGKLYTY